MSHLHKTTVDHPLQLELLTEPLQSILYYLQPYLSYEILHRIKPTAALSAEKMFL